MEKPYVEELFKSLRVSLNNASIYFKEHPLFLKSIEDLKNKIDTVFRFKRSLKIGFTSKGLWFEGKLWEDERLYEELAKFFHYRRVKAIEIKDGINIKELTSFLINISLPPKDILKRGGIKNILEKEGVLSVEVEELDYSQFLKGEGKDIRDVWTYLFREVVDKKDIKQFNNFVENFSQILSKFRVQDFLESEELRDNLHKFFLYLKETDQNNFNRCIKIFAQLLLREKSIPEEGIKHLKRFFHNLSDKDLADTLWEEIKSDNDFNIFAFKLFSQLIDEKRHKDVSYFLKHKADKDSLSSNLRIRRKVKELISSPEIFSIPDTYRHSLSLFLKEVESYKGGVPFPSREIVFDRSLLKKNYCLMLLNLLVMENDGEKIKLILDRIIDERQTIVNDSPYLRNLLDSIEEIRSKFSFSRDTFEDINKKISIFMENVVFENRNLPIPYSLLEFIKKPSFNFDFYINEIFIYNRVTPSILQLFFKFFPDRLFLFYRKLRKRKLDLVFLKKMVDSLSRIDSPIALDVLKFIFSFTNEIMKIEVIKAMESFSFYDEKFLCSLLRKGNFFLKKEAAKVLKKRGETKRIVNALFSFFNPLGLRSYILEESVIIIKELALKEARSQLNALCRKKIFLSKNLYRKIKDVLEEWNGREN
jgi:hypothetical protein